MAQALEGSSGTGLIASQFAQGTEEGRAAVRDASQRAIHDSAESPKHIVDVGAPVKHEGQSLLYNTSLSRTHAFAFAVHSRARDSTRFPSVCAPSEESREANMAVNSQGTEAE